MVNPVDDSDAEIFASADSLVRGAMKAWKPPARLRLSEWADRHFYLSAESAAEPGRWKTLPYQRGIMDAITDPYVEQVSVMKSARVGYTKIVDATIGYYMHQDPCPIMVVQPTIEDAQGFSKEEIAPMLRDCPELSALLAGDGERDSDNTILHKVFRGGSLSVVGANSGRGFRRVSRKIVIFDEVDGYPASAGKEGDQIKLGIRRTEYYHDRKIISGSTPLLAGNSRIETMFLAGDQRRYFVPCTHCAHMDFLVFRENSETGGHFMHWPKGRPEDAHFICSRCGCEIEHKDKREIVTHGEWRAGADFHRHASFHVWAAYSFSPNATWGQLAAEFVEANANGPDTLKTFVNTVLGETWTEKGEAPDWERLYQRREHYQIGSVPAGAKFLTAGVDVQQDRFVYEIVGWGDGKESWSVDAGVIMGDTAADATWRELDELLAQTFPGADGLNFPIAVLAIDSGYNTQTVYNWARQKPMSRVMAIKGQSHAKTLIGVPSPVDVNFRGKRIARGYKVWPVGVDIAKSELYGWLRQQPPTTESGDLFPIGFCHFPEYGEDYFKQITSEHLVKTLKRSGFTSMEWQMIPGRENHWLDCRVYARAAASVAGLDRLVSKRVNKAPPPAPLIPIPAGPAPAPPSSEAAPTAQPIKPRNEGGWIGGGRVGFGRGNWLSRKR